VTTATDNLHVVGDQCIVSGTLWTGVSFRFSAKYTDAESGLIYYGYRYYQPSTGRWLSRDPLGEKAFEGFHGQLNRISRQAPYLSDYVFVSNQALTGTDTLGLLSLARGGCCGPDVTLGIAATMLKVSSTFKGWTWGQQRKACWALVLPREATDAWDIYPLYYLGYSPVNFQLAPGRQGTRDCRQTVAYRGSCYNASDVNYTLFGYVMKLCHDTFDSEDTGSLWQVRSVMWDLPQAYDLISIYRIVWGMSAVDQAKAFTKFGFSGGTPAETCPYCKVDESNEAGETSFTETNIIQ
jgi:RHS repeat-associated protein